MKNSVDYYGILLMKGSTAYELYQEIKLGKEGAASKLKKHMTQLETNRKELITRYG